MSENCNSTLKQDGSIYHCELLIGHDGAHEEGSWQWHDPIGSVLHVRGDGKQQEAHLNTDRELWRGKSRAEFGDPDAFYADSIFVTADDKGIGLNCGGYVIVKPIREWFALARQASQPSPASGELVSRFTSDTSLIAHLSDRTTSDCACALHRFVREQVQAMGVSGEPIEPGVDQQQWLEQNGIVEPGAVEPPQDKLAAHGWNIEQILVYVWQCMSGEQSEQEYPYSRFANSEMSKRLRLELERLPVCAAREPGASERGSR